VLEKGINLGGYRIDGVLGVGGMGVVYEATQLSLERTVALKLISTDLGSDEGFRERFRREGMIQAAIDHPHIVPVYEAGESEHGLFIAMRLIRGRNLKDLIVGGELTPGRTTHLLTQVAGALDSAHEVGLIHRDIKPYNILVDDRRDHAYLADFGVTKARSRPNLTKTGQMVGTLDYMAPEQIRGQSATEQTDIYALGCVLYESFTGTVPFYRETDAAVLYAHLSEPLPSVREHRSDLPEQLDAVLGKAMAKKPEERYESATELLRDIAAAVPVQDTAAPIVAPTVARPDGDGAPATVPPEPAQETGAPAEPGTVPAGAAGTAAPADVSPTEVPAGPETVLAESTPPPATEVPAGPETVLAPTTPAPETEAPQTEVPAGPETVLAASTPPPPTEAPVEEEIPQTTPAPETVLAADSAAAIDDAHVQTQTGATVPRPGAAPVAAVAAEPAAPARPRPSGVSGALVGGALVAVVVLAVIAFVIGRASGGGEESTAPDQGANTITLGRATVPVPTGWRKLEPAPIIPGLGLYSLSAWSPATTKAGGLESGTTPQTWPTFLPSGFTNRVPDSAIDGRDIVMLGDRQAFRYQDLRPRGFDGVVTLYVIPRTKNPTITLACFATGGSTIPSGCESAVAGTTIEGGEIYQLTLPKDYASKLNSVLANVERARSNGVKKLKSADKASQQATAASSIAAAYSNAAKDMGPANATPYIKPLNDALIAALRNTSGAYNSLAAAARAQKSARYKQASKNVTAAEQRVRTAVNSLQALGFSVS
jgi:Protein kinase domain